LLRTFAVSVALHTSIETGLSQSDINENTVKKEGVHSGATLLGSEVQFYFSVVT
jgi:hypothetical protein